MSLTLEALSFDTFDMLRLLSRFLPLRAVRAFSMRLRRDRGPECQQMASVVTKNSERLQAIPSFGFSRSRSLAGTERRADCWRPPATRTARGRRMLTILPGTHPGPPVLDGET